MNLNRVVPYLSRINSCEGTRENPQLLYVTKGGKKNSLTFFDGLLPQDMIESCI